MLSSLVDGRMKRAILVMEVEQSKTDALATSRSHPAGNRTGPKLCPFERDPALLEYLNVREVAAILQVCPETVRRHVRAGRLPVLAISRRLHRFTRADVLAFVERSREARP